MVVAVVAVAVLVVVVKFYLNRVQFNVTLILSRATAAFLRLSLLTRSWSEKKQKTKIKKHISAVQGSQILIATIAVQRLLNFKP